MKTQMQPSTGSVLTGPVTKIKFLAAALFLSASILQAQNESKPATIRMKKTVIVNGVEKTTDTTFTTNDPSSVKVDGGTLNIEEIKDEKGNVRKIVTIRDEKNMNEGSKVIVENGADNKMIVIKSGDKMTAEDEEKLKKAGVNIDMINIDNNKSAPNGEDEQVIVKNIRCQGSPSDSIKKFTTIVLIKKVNIVTPSDEELKQLGKQTALGDNKLTPEKINFYPNPNNGKFNLAFTLPKKADTDISIYNLEGKSVYNEKLPNFSGNYDKEIDISRNPKGIYFFKVSQGSSSHVKKIVVE